MQTCTRITRPPYTFHILPECSRPRFLNAEAKNVYKQQKFLGQRNAPSQELNRVFLRYVDSFDTYDSFNIPPSARSMLLRCYGTIDNATSTKLFDLANAAKPCAAQHCAKHTLQLGEGQRQMHSKHLSLLQVDRGFARSRLCTNEDGNTNNLVLYTVRNDTSKKGGNAPRATD